MISSTRIIKTLIIALLSIPLSGQAQGSAIIDPVTPTERDAMFPSRDTIEFGRIEAEGNGVGCHGSDG